MHYRSKNIDDMNYVYLGEDTAFIKANEISLYYMAICCNYFLHIIIFVKKFSADLNYAF